jgi:hypothetical protein
MSPPDGVAVSDIPLGARLLKLLRKVKRQSRLIRKLETQHPKIFHVERDGDGAIPLNDWDGDVDQLIKDICQHLEEDR